MTGRSTSVAADRADPRGRVPLTVARDDRRCLPGTASNTLIPRSAAVSARAKRLRHTLFHTL
jgi:hypothetical protein